MKSSIKIKTAVTAVGVLTTVTPTYLTNMEH